MAILDTHAHYQDEAFNEDRDELLSSFPSKGICAVLNAATNMSSARETIALSEKYPFCYAAVGLHPSDILPDVNQYSEDEILSTFKHQYLNNSKVVAIGEIGLEYHYDDVPKELQRYWFEKQLELAVTLDAPVIVHDREAHEDTLRLLQKYKPKGVVHCFSGSVEMLKEVLKIGMSIGLGGAVTFKNARKPVEAAAFVPADRLVLETDAPYMSPVPFRGTRCHSGMIQNTAEVIAAVRGVSVENLLEQTKINAFELFPKLNS